MALSGFPLLPLGASAAQVAGNLARRVQETLSNVASSEDASSPSPATKTNTATLREVLGRYDLERISPEEVTALARELREAGLIRAEEYEQLVGIRVELELAGVSARERIDLAKFLRERIAALESEQRSADAVEDSGRDAAAALERLDGELGLIERLAALGNSDAALDASV